MFLKWCRRVISRPYVAYSFCSKPLELSRSLGYSNEPPTGALKKAWLTSYTDDDETPFKNFAAIGPTVSKLVVTVMEWSCALSLA